MKLYTEEQVKKLLAEQRYNCSDRTGKRNYYVNDLRAVNSEDILNAEEPPLPPEKNFTFSEWLGMLGGNTKDYMPKPSQDEKVTDSKKENTAVWQSTMMLRWVDEGKFAALQQKWICDSGEEEWRDIELSK